MKPLHKFIAGITLLIVLTTLFISANRYQYTEEIVHMQCNDRFRTEFQKNRTVNSWTCTHGPKTVEIKLTEHNIPAPSELLFYYISLAAAFLGGRHFGGGKNS